MKSVLFNDIFVTQVKTFMRWYSQIFHWDVETFFDKEPGSVQYIPIRDYYHRHQRAYFWLITEHSPWFKYFIVRLLLGWILPIPGHVVFLIADIFSCGNVNKLKVLLAKSSNIICQDFILAEDNFVEVTNMVDQELKVIISI